MSHSNNAPILGDCATARPLCANAVCPPPRVSSQDAAGLTVQQVAQLQHEHARGKADGWLVEVILDMDNLKLSFAVNGGNAIDARVDLPESVCP